jgi:EAL domain-containing protein (putative c-di-GMP-specific phosphodiesterase class I)
MSHSDVAPISLNIVVLCSSPAWKLDVFDQARDLGLGLIRTARTPQEAMGLLADRSPPVSHLLLEPASAGDQLAELVDVALRHEAGINLVVLDEPWALPDHPSASSMVFVPSPTRGWLRRVLNQDGALQGRRPANDGPSIDELTEALFQARIQTRYQPIVRMSDGHPVGLEVLARLELPKYGFLLPDKFVPQIEAIGLAWPLTQAVITRAFADWGAGRLGSFGLTLAVNFPLDVLLIPEALAWMETKRRQAGLPAERIVIELTESRPVSELARLRHAISTLRGIGYGLAIDDVGPQLRDHHSLLDLQFTALKLDKELVTESADVPEASAFLLDTIASARASNLTIVAEGVENPRLWQRMRDLGVDQAQGYLIARPLLATTVPLWYNDWVSLKRRPPVTH